MYILYEIVDGLVESGSREKTVGEIKHLDDTNFKWVDAGVAFIPTNGSAHPNQVKSNVQAEEVKAYNTLKNRMEKFSLTFCDKQKQIVIISRNAEQSMLYEI